MRTIERNVAGMLGAILAAGACLSTAVAAEKVGLKSLENELWWDGVVRNALNVPYAETSGDRPFGLMNNGKANQTAPLMLSSQGRWVWSDAPFAFQVKDSTLHIDPMAKVEHGQAGTTLRDAYLHLSKTYFPPSGKMVDPIMLQKPQYNTWIELDVHQNQKDVLKYAQGIVDAGLPPGVLMIDDMWETEYGDLEFDPDKFPDPKAMVAQLHKMGFKVVLWVTPYVHHDSKKGTSKHYASLAEKGYFIKLKDSGKPALMGWWQGKSGFLDLTNPGAVTWYKTQLDRLIADYGIDGFKFDGGDDRFWGRRGIYKNLTSHDKNATGNDHSEAYAKIGLDYPLNEFRACWKMGGQPLGQRLYDKDYSYEALHELIPSMCSLGLLGHAFTCPDMIGGGLIGAFKEVRKSGNFDQELIVRATQLHALMPMMQFSVAPWRILDEKHLNMVKEATALHVENSDLFLRLAKEAAQTGEPIVRYMEYVFPHQGFAEVKDQFMIGNELLVAPVLTKETYKRTIRFPAGTWAGDDGSIVVGPKTLEVDAPLNRLPHYRLKAGKQSSHLKASGSSNPKSKETKASVEKASDAPVIRLWPIDMVGGEENRLKKVYRDRNGRQQLCGVIDPYLTVYPAESVTPTPALVFCPGGAYKILGLPSAADIKNWNDLGITVFVLKYRIPDQLDEAFQDVQRAVRLVRSQAKQWNIDPDNIGLYGGSAGGHLSARLTQNYDQTVYEPIDEADKLSCEPQFAILQCAAYFQGRSMDKEFDAELFHMKNKTAPTFLTYSKDDKFCRGGVEYAKRLTDAGGSIELKLFETGGHGMRGCDWFGPMTQWLEGQQQRHQGE